MRPAQSRARARLSIGRQSEASLCQGPVRGASSMVWSGGRSVVVGSGNDLAEEPAVRGSRPRWPLEAFPSSSKGRVRRGAFDGHCCITAARHRWGRGETRDGRFVRGGIDACGVFAYAESPAGRRRHVRFASNATVPPDLPHTRNAGHRSLERLAITRPPAEHRRRTERSLGRRRVERTSALRWVSAGGSCGRVLSVP